MKKILCFMMVLFGCTIADEAPEILCKPSFTVVGIACKTSLAHALEEIPEHWGRFFNEDVTERIPNKVSDDVFALYCDYEGDYTQPYTLVIGCQVDDNTEVPEGMVAKVVPQSLYAKFTATGAFPDSVINTWRTVWQSNLPRSYAGDFEVYGEAFQDKDKQVDVYISLFE